MDRLDFFKFVAQNSDLNCDRLYKLAASSGNNKRLTLTKIGLIFISFTVQGYMIPHSFLTATACKKQVFKVGEWCYVIHYVIKI